MRDAGVDAPQQEARRLMALADGRTAAELIAVEDAAVPAATAQRFSAYVGRRASREPFAHIAGRAGFYGLDLLSDRRALIPRADSETVVDVALERFSEGRVADLGAGSGCLIAAILSARPAARGIALEKEPAAAALLDANLKGLGLAGRAEAAVGDWQDWAGWKEMDLIVSNPPYIRSAEIERLAPEVRDHDPRGALDGGPDGLAAFREIAASAGRRMRRDAWLVLEIGFDQAADVSALLAGAGFSDISVAADLGGHPRVVAGRRAQ